MKEIQLPFIDRLKATIGAKPSLIQVVIGPRQVGKTTGMKQLLAQLPAQSFRYESADAIIGPPTAWIFEKWHEALSNSRTELLVIDEVQKIENWSDAVKKLWDEQQNHSRQLQLVLLGSSSLDIQKGLSESLAGRFFVHKVYHWNAEESRQAYNLSLDEYLRFGGYPGSYPFIQSTEQWLNYMNESIINPVIGKDILSQARVKSPALFKQCFDIVCAYPAQEISYTKLLGQLQDRGNTDLVKHYLELFESAFLIKQIFKFSNRHVRSRTSSPKILPLCPALFSAQQDADLNDEELGRVFELSIGAALVRLPGRLFYWREKNAEVDYVYQNGKRLVAIEVKSGRKKSAKGLMKFCEQFSNAVPLVITRENYNEALRRIALE
ncbi:MAG: ATP-binding protein [Deltaproteobacteria bacterium]|nr:ATP-binding protein [Deltaproteobacteria bacterium]